MKGLLIAVALATPVAGGIDWHPTFEDALALAASEEKVVFIAVNMDGERANNRTVKEVYGDKQILALSELTVNLVASNATHVKGDRPCSRFGAITCAEHRRVDVSVRGQVLHPDDEGYVVAPQHVWLNPDGEVLLSVPYFISAPEMEWCFVTALRTVDPEFEFRLSPGARAPKGLILGDVFDSKSAGEKGRTGPTREEAMDLLDQLKRGVEKGQRDRLIRRLARADEPEARKYIISVLRAGGRGRGMGGGRGSGGEGEEQGDRRAKLLRWVGVGSPPSYWEVAAEFISSGEEVLRREAVVALEQLAAPESLRAIRSALKKEKDPAIKKNLYRALGAVGAADKGARKLLLKQAKDQRSDLWRLNSIIALGYLAQDESVDELLAELIEETEGPDQIAATLAIALTRNGDWIEVLKAKEQDEATGEELKEVLKVSIGVLEGQPLSTIREAIKKVASDELPRRRSFAVQRQE